MKNSMVHWQGENVVAMKVGASLTYGSDERRSKKLSAFYADMVVMNEGASLTWENWYAQRVSIWMS